MEITIGCNSPRRMCVSKLMRSDYSEPIQIKNVFTINISSYSILTVDILDKMNV